MLTKKETSVLHVLLKLGSFFGKRYVFPTQKTIVRLSANWSLAKMSRRTLNRVLASLEEKGFIERVRRHSKKSTGELWLRSTLYKLRLKAFEWCWRMKGFLNEIWGIIAVPRMAHNLSEKEDHLNPVENWDL